MSHCRLSATLALLLLLVLPASVWAEPAAVAEVVVEDVEGAPVGFAAVDHLVRVERVLQGSVPGTSLIVRVPAARRSTLEPGARAVLSLAPDPDGSFRLLSAERPQAPAAAAAGDRRYLEPAATVGLEAFTEGELADGWMAAQKIVTGIFEGNGFVSTLAALNLQDIVGNVTVLLRNADGELIDGPIPVFFSSRSLRLLPLSRMFPDVVGHRGPFTVELLSNDIFFAASTILLEIESQDQIFIPALPTGSGTTGELFFPRVVHMRGAFETSQASRLIAFNPAEEGRLLTLEFWERGQDNTAPRMAYRYIEPGRSLRVDDILPDLFGVDDGIGALRVTWSGPAGPAPRIVTLMFSGTAGGQGKRYGTLVDSATAASTIRTHGIDTGIQQTADSRTNFGVVSLSSTDVNLRLMLKDAEGLQLAAAQISLKPRQHLERNVAGLFPGIAEGTGWAIETEVVGGGSVLTYLNRIDASGDISYLPGHLR